jgi:hypothetical protein
MSATLNKIVLFGIKIPEARFETLTPRPGCDHTGEKGKFCPECGKPALLYNKEQEIYDGDRLGRFVVRTHDAWVGRERVSSAYIGVEIPDFSSIDSLRDLVISAEAILRELKATLYKHNIDISGGEFGLHAVSSIS